MTLIWRRENSKILNTLESHYFITENLIADVHEHNIYKSRV